MTWSKRPDGNGNDNGNGNDGDDDDDDDEDEACAEAAAENTCSVLRTRCIAAEAAAYTAPT